MFLDGDATPLQLPPLVGSLLINPFRTTAVRLALRSNWLIRSVYDSQCGPKCLGLTAAGVSLWRLPLQQQGFRTNRELHAAPRKSEHERC